MIILHPSVRNQDVLSYLQVHKVIRRGGISGVRATHLYLHRSVITEQLGAFHSLHTRENILEV